MLASARSIVTVEEIVRELEPRPGGVVLPGWAIDAVSLAPGGAHPSYAHGYYDRDNAFYVALGRDQPRPRHVHGLDAAPRARDARTSREYRRSLRDAERRSREDDGAATPPTR